MKDIKYQGISDDFNGRTCTEITENQRATDFVNNLSLDKRGNFRIPRCVLLLILSTFLYFDGLFQVRLLNLMKFQALCNISMSLWVCLNYLLDLGNSPFCQRRMSWHEWACYKWQLCGLPSDSSALNYIPYLHVVPFLCTMRLMYDVMWVKQFHHRHVIMAKIYFMVKGYMKFCKRAAAKNV